MLQQWCKPVTIALTPECLAINSGKKTTRSIELASTMVDKLSWNQGVAELENNVAIIGSRKVRVILSNHYVRYAILPWQAGIYSQQDWQALAENYLRTMYGNLVDNWKISVAMQGYKKPLIVSAIDLVLLTQLEQLAIQYKWQLESVEPALMTVLNCYHRKINNNDWLVMVEPQRVVLVEIVAGCVVNFSIACPPPDQESVEGAKLISRAQKLKNNDLPVVIHLFCGQGLQLSTAEENITMNVLFDNTERLLTGIMLAELS